MVKRWRGVKSEYLAYRLYMEAHDPKGSLKWCNIGPEEAKFYVWRMSLKDPIGGLMFGVVPSKKDVIRAKAMKKKEPVLAFLDLVRIDVNGKFIPGHSVLNKANPEHRVKYETAKVILRKFFIQEAERNVRMRRDGLSSKAR